MTAVGRDGGDFPADRSERVDRPKASFLVVADRAVWLAGMVVVLLGDGMLDAVGIWAQYGLILINRNRPQERLCPAPITRVYANLPYTNPHDLKALWVPYDTV